MTFSPPIAIYPASPPAGQRFQYQFNPKAIINLLSVSFTLTTSATAGTRRMLVAVVSGGTLTMASLTFSGTTGLSKATFQYTAANGIGGNGIAGTNCYCPLPPGPYPSGGTTGGVILRIKGSNNFSATDQIKNIAILFQESTYG